MVKGFAIKRRFRASSARLVGRVVWLPAAEPAGASGPPVRGAPGARQGASGGELAPSGGRSRSRRDRPVDPGAVVCPGLPGPRFARRQAVARDHAQREASERRADEGREPGGDQRRATARPDPGGASGLCTPAERRCHSECRAQPRPIDVARCHWRPAGGSTGRLRQRGAGADGAPTAAGGEGIAVELHRRRQTRAPKSRKIPSRAGCGGADGGWRSRRGGLGTGRRFGDCGAGPRWRLRRCRDWRFRQTLRDGFGSRGQARLQPPRVPVPGDRRRSIGREAVAHPLRCGVGPREPAVAVGRVLGVSRAPVRGGARPSRRARLLRDRGGPAKARCDAVGGRRRAGTRCRRGRRIA
jgi:hypothetical protein